MHRLAVVVFCCLIGGSAFAQTPPATIGERYIPAPWWMREPVIASIGYVRTEAPANRARFSANFQVVDKTVEEATRKAAEKVQALVRSLAGYGADKVQVETTFNMRPIYDQYRNKEGQLLDNQRPDKIDVYEVSANVSVRVRDMAVLERVYGAMLSARPSSASTVLFQLEPANELQTWLNAEAVKDAARRARESAAAAGARLGAVKVIDPTGRACQTDVLAGWPSYGGGVMPRDVDSDDYDAPPAPPPPPPPPPPGLAIQVVMQPPMQQLTAQACVVYGLSG